MNRSVKANSIESKKDFCSNIVGPRLRSIKRTDFDLHLEPQTTQSRNHHYHEVESVGGIYGQSIAVPMVIKVAQMHTENDVIQFVFYTVLLKWTLK